MINNISSNWLRGLCHCRPMCRQLQPLLNLDDSSIYKKAVSEVWRYKYCLISKLHYEIFIVIVIKKNKTYTMWTYLLPELLHDIQLLQVSHILGGLGAQLYELRVLEINVINPISSICHHTSQFLLKLSVQERKFWIFKISMPIIITT